MQFIGEWGNSGTEPGQMADPQVLTTDSVGNVFVADQKSPVQIEKFDGNGHPRLAFDAMGSHDPSDLAVDPGGAIFLLDTRAARIQIFNPEGKGFRSFYLRYRRSFKMPTSLAMDPSGNFYVADRGTSRIVRMDPRGRILESWGKPKNLPADHWAPCRVRQGPDGNLYVADAENQQIEKLSADGSYISRWDFAFSDSQAAPRDAEICGFSVGQEYVAASNDEKRIVQIWTLDGQPKLTVDFSQHPEWGAKAAPADLAFDSKGTLFVLDRADTRVLRFRLNLAAGDTSQPSN